MERYVLHWGEMGTRWGVNRSIAQVHALLYLWPHPLNAEEIVEALSIARSNVSTSLKELQGMGLVEVTHVLGDRRDHFTSIKDTWTMLMTIVENRKRKEVDPTLSMLKTCVAESKSDGTPKDVQDRMENMLTFMDTLTKWYEQVRNIPKSVLVKLMKLGSGVTKFVR